MGRKQVEKGQKAYNISIVIICFTSLLLFYGLTRPMCAQAKTPSLPPHLIQTVSEEDIYEGMLALDMLKCSVSEKEDPEAASAYVRDSVVRIDMGKAYGSGVIFRLTKDGAVIATNRHVLDYWNEEEGAVCFSQGWYTSARMLGSDKDCDVGFLQVDKEELGLEALMELKSVPVEAEVYGSLQKGAAAFCLGADRALDEIRFEAFWVEETDRYIETFGGTMLYGRGFAKEGMSGGGMFDGYGHFIGLLSGGTWQNEIAGVPVYEVERAYREIAGE